MGVPLIPISWNLTKLSGLGRGKLAQSDDGDVAIVPLHCCGVMKTTSDGMTGGSV